jgi:uncharacterized protein YycO
MKIALYQGKSLLSRAIRWQTRSIYSHAAFLLNDGSVIEAWQPRVRHVESLSAQHTPGTTVDIFDFVDPLTRSESDRLEKLAMADLGIPYDYQSVFRFLTRERETAGGRKKLFCSEQVFSLCAGIDRHLLARTEAWRVPPDWIARSTRLFLEQTIITT